MRDRLAPRHRAGQRERASNGGAAARVSTATATCSVSRRATRDRRPTSATSSTHCSAWCTSADRVATRRSSTTCSPRTASTARAPIRGLHRASRPSLPVPGRCLVARGRARPLPPRARTDVHGDRSARRGVGPRRTARRPRLQDRWRPPRARRRRRPRARLQAWFAAPLAARDGLRIRVRYEHLAAEVGRRPGSVRARDRGARRRRGGAPTRRRVRARRGDFAGVHDCRDLRRVPLPGGVPRHRGPIGADVAGTADVDDRTDTPPTLTR